MELTVHQTITIHLLRINNMTNSSVLQIGTSGTIRAQSEVHGTETTDNVAEDQPDIEPVPYNENSSLIHLPAPDTNWLNSYAKY